MCTQGKPGRTVGGVGRTVCACSAAIALVLLPVLLCSGCGDEMEQEFRQAAIGGIETGLNSIVDGLLDGVFAVATPSSTSSTSSSGTSGSGSSTSSGNSSTTTGS